MWHGGRSPSAECEPRGVLQAVKFEITDLLGATTCFVEPMRRTRVRYPSRDRLKLRVAPRSNGRS